MNRRSFLAAAAGSVAPVLGASIPIIDTHIHLFDTNRPEGVPWPEKTNKALYQPALPDRYRKIAVPLGITGAIKIEASPWFNDNQWVLDLIEKEPLFVGMIGDLEVGKPDFGKNLDRFHKNKLYLGIRYGNIWNRDLGRELANPQFVSDMKLLPQAGLTLDSANPTPQLLEAILKLSDKVPNLRIVVDHLPQMGTPAPQIEKEFTGRPQIFVKISSVYRKVDGKIPTDLGFYKGRLDQIFGVFGEDRVLYGSDWPDSDNWKPYPEVLRIVKEYFATKSQAQQEKYFWRNSVKAYHWVKRAPNQPS